MIKKLWKKYTCCLTTALCMTAYTYAQSVEVTIESFGMAQNNIFNAHLSQHIGRDLTGKRAGFLENRANSWQALQPEA